MRSILIPGLLAIGVALAAPAHAQSNLLDNAQRFLNGNNQSNQDAYERGRQDQARAERERRREDWQDRHRDQDLNQRDPDRYSQRYSDPHDRYSDQRYNRGY